MLDTIKRMRSACGPRTGATAVIALALIAGDMAVRTVRAQPDPAPGVITAQEFRLVDKAGKTRAALALRDDGSPSLNLLDTNGHVRATVRLGPDGSSAISLHEADGTQRAGLSVRSDGSAGITLSNKQGKGGAALILKPDGDPVGIFQNHTGAVTWTAPELAIPPVEK